VSTNRSLAPPPPAQDAVIKEPHPPARQGGGHRGVGLGGGHGSAHHRLGGHMAAQSHANAAQCFMTCTAASNSLRVLYIDRNDYLRVRRRAEAQERQQMEHIFEATN